MQVIREEATTYYQELFEDYMHCLQEDHGIKSVEQYFEFAGAIDRIDDFEEVCAVVDEKDIGLACFLECPPLLDQDIMYATLNPGMKSTISPAEFEPRERKQYGNNHERAGDCERLAWRFARDFHGYLTHSKNPGARLVVETMRDSFDWLPGENEIDFEEYVTPETRSELPSSYFGDVHHTVFFRLPSPDGSFLDHFDRQYWRARFAEEIRLLDPQAIVTGCRDVWLSIHDHLVEDADREIIPHRGANLCRKYGLFTDESAAHSVFEIPTLETWIVTTGHESRPSFLKSNVLEDNLRYVNKQLRNE